MLKKNLKKERAVTSALRECVCVCVLLILELLLVIEYSFRKNNIFSRKSIFAVGGVQTLKNTINLYLLSVYVYLCVGMFRVDGWVFAIFIFFFYTLLHLFFRYPSDISFFFLFLDRQTLGTNTPRHTHRYNPFLLPPPLYSHK